MRELRLNREINPNGQILRDDKGNLTGISLSSDLVKIRNLSIDTLTSSTGTIPTEGSLYFEGSEGLRFNLVDSFTEKSGALTSSGDVAVGMNRWANALTQLWIYEPIASPVDYFIITVLANGATSINTVDGAGSDAPLSLIPDGDLNLTPLTGDVVISNAISEKPQLILKNTTNDTNGSSIKFLKDKGAAAVDNDIIGSLTFYGDNDAQQETQFASIVSSIADASDGVEGGKLEFQVASHDGEVVTGLELQDGSLEDEIDVTIASGTSSRTIVSGALTMYGETFTLQNATASHPQMLIRNINDDANGGNIHFYKNSGSTADNDSLGTITWGGDNDNLLDPPVTPCRIDGQFLDVSDGAEKGRINLDVAEYDGTLTTGLTVFGTATNGQVDVTLGASATSTIGFSGKLQVPEISSPSAPADGAGGYLYTKTDGKPYWISNEVSETDLSASGGGGGTNNHIVGVTGRAYTRYLYWYYPNTSYGFGYYNWNSTFSSTSLRTTWLDSYHPQLVLPVAMTLKSYHFYFNATSGQDLEFACLKGTGVTYGSAGDFSLSNVGAVQAVTSMVANVYHKAEQTGLSVSFAAGDMIMPVVRRTELDTSSYVFVELSFSAVFEID